MLFIEAVKETMRQAKKADQMRLLYRTPSGKYGISATLLGAGNERLGSYYPLTYSRPGWYWMIDRMTQAELTQRFDGM